MTDYYTFLLVFAILVGGTTAITIICSRKLVKKRGLQLVVNIYIMVNLILTIIMLFGAISGKGIVLYNSLTKDVNLLNFLILDYIFGANILPMTIIFLRIKQR